MAHDNSDYLNAKFIGWLKRNGGAKHLTTCERKLRHLGLDIDSTIDSWDHEKIAIVLSRGDKVVWLRDIEWGDMLAKEYDVEVPHHSQLMTSKEKLG